MNKVMLIELKKKICKLQKDLYFRNLIHPILLRMMKKKTTGDLEVRNNHDISDNVLIVAKHLCIEDIPTLAQAIRKHFYLMVSDEDKNTLDGFGLNLNGVAWIERLVAESCHKAKEKAIHYLKKRRFAMYPEATWNLSPNLLMLPFKRGCTVIANEAMLIFNRLFHRFLRPEGLVQ